MSGMSQLISEEGLKIAAAEQSIEGPPCCKYAWYRDRSGLVVGVLYRIIEIPGYRPHCWKILDEISARSASDSDVVANLIMSQSSFVRN